MGRSRGRGKAFQLTGFPQHVKEELTAAITQLGGQCTETENFVLSCTHIVCSKPSRSEKYLGGLATGKWLVTADYVRRSKKAGKWLLEEEFEWDQSKRHLVPADLHGYLSTAHKWRQQMSSFRQGAFVGWRAAVLVDNPQKQKVYKSLILNGSGAVVNISLPVEDPRKVASQVTHVFVDEKNTSAVEPLIRAGVPCLKPLYIGAFLLIDPPPDPRDYASTAPDGTPIKRNRAASCPQGTTVSSQRSSQRRSARISPSSCTPKKLDVSLESSILMTPPQPSLRSSVSSSKNITPHTATSSLSRSIGQDTASTAPASMKSRVNNSPAVAPVMNTRGRRNLKRGQPGGLPPTPQGGSAALRQTALDLWLSPAVKQTMAKKFTKDVLTLRNTNAQEDRSSPIIVKEEIIIDDSVAESQNRHARKVANGRPVNGRKSQTGSRCVIDLTSERPVIDLTEKKKSHQRRKYTKEDVMVDLTYGSSDEEISIIKQVSWTKGQSPAEMKAKTPKVEDTCRRNSSELRGHADCRSSSPAAGDKAINGHAADSVVTGHKGMPSGTSQAASSRQSSRIHNRTKEGKYQRGNPEHLPAAILESKFARRLPSQVPDPVFMPSSGSSLSQSQMSDASSCGSQNSNLSLTQHNRVMPASLQTHAPVPDPVFLPSSGEASQKASDSSTHESHPDVKDSQSLVTSDSCTPPAKRRRTLEDPPMDNTPVEEHRPVSSLSKCTDPLKICPPEVITKTTASSQQLVPVKVPRVTVDKRPLVLAMSSKAAAIFNACVDEEQYLSGVDQLLSFMSASRYPSIEMLKEVIHTILLPSEDPVLSHRASRALHRALRQHPPTSSALQLTYRLALLPKDTDSTLANNPWNVIKDCINDCLGSAEISPQVQHNNLLVLQFVVELLELDCRHCASAPGVGPQKSLKSLVVQIWWPSGQRGQVNSNCQQLFAALVDALVAPDEDLPFPKTELTQVIYSLISLVAYVTCVSNRRESLSLPHSAVVFARDLTYCIKGELETRPQQLEAAVAGLKPPWLKMTASQTLLDLYDDQLVAAHSEGALSMHMIVSRYFYLLPPVQGAESQADSQGSNTSMGRRGQKESSKGLPMRCTSPGKQNMPLDAATKRKVAAANRRNMRGETPLILACIKNNVAKVRQLLALPGIDVNMKDYAGWTALHEAATNGSLDCLQELLAFKPQKNIRSYFNRPSSSKQEGALDLHCVNDEGITPLHEAIDNNHKDVAQLLLEYGGAALLSVRSVDGLTPSELVRSEEMKAVIQSSTNNQHHASPDPHQPSVEQGYKFNSCPSKRPQNVKSGALTYMPVEEQYSCAWSRRQKISSAEECAKLAALILYLVQSYLTTCGMDTATRELQDCQAATFIHHVEGFHEHLKRVGVVDSPLCKTKLLALSCLAKATHS